MKVKELIEILSQLDEEREIYVDDGEVWREDAYHEISHVGERVFTWENRETEKYLVIEPKF